MKYYISILLIGASLMQTPAQLPNTNIYVLNMDRSGASSYQFSRPRFLTAFNIYGYNNQPYFINNNELYITVQAPDDTTQTDIYSLNLLNDVKTRVTATPEAEYSPQLSPDHGYFSCIRADAGKSKTQRLWVYPLDRSGEGQAVLKYTTDVGYYCWLGNDKLAIFKLNGASNYLMLTNTKDESSVQLTNNIGRTLLQMPDGKLAYIQKATEQTWYIKSMDPLTYSSEIIIQTLPYKEDFVLLSDGTFLMGSGSKLYSYKMGEVRAWKEIADFEQYGILNIKRIAISRESDKIAIVDDLNR